MKTMPTLKIIRLLMVACGLSASAAVAQETPTGLDVMKRYDEQIRARTEQVEMTMSLINKDGRVRSRELISLSKLNAEGKQDQLLRFAEPADVRGTALLTHEHANGEDDRWLYLPALRKVRRIAATDDSDNFMGSDFAYEDIEFEELEAYEYTVVRVENRGGADCYVVQAIPSKKKSEESGYGKRLLWIRKDNSFMIAADYFNKRGELIKQRKALGLKLIDGTDKWRPSKQEIQNIKTGHRTELVYKGVIIGAEVPDDAFSLRELQRGI